MKLYTRGRLVGYFIASLALASLGVAAHAATLTPAATTIGNTATVNYQVGGVDQTAINSNRESFVVDNLLNLSLVKVDSTIVNVSPGQTATVLTYQVTNNGNDTQGVTFTATNEANGTTNPFSGQPNDNFDVTSPTVHVSKSDTTTYSDTDDTATSIPQLAAGDSKYVFVISDIPASQADGDSAVVKLESQVAEPGGSAAYGTTPGTDITTDDSAAAWTPGTLQKIFADSDGTYDGKASADDAVLVVSATLTITKTSSVVSDPTGATIPHAIPGAVIMYTITVVNNGSATATNINVTDDLSGQTTNLDLANTGTSIKAYSNGGTSDTCGSSGVTCTFSSNTVTVTGLTANTAAGTKTAKVTFEVKIK